MQAQNRLVSFPPRQLALGAALVVAAALLVLVLLASVHNNPRIPSGNSHTTALSSTQHDQAPDAKERNDIYSQALAQRFYNQSPDAQERNETLSSR
jgi:hypothetical protein